MLVTVQFDKKYDQKMKDMMLTTQRDYKVYYCGDLASISEIHGSKCTSCNQKMGSIETSDSQEMWILFALQTEADTLALLGSLIQTGLIKVQSTSSVRDFFEPRTNCLSCKEDEITVINHEMHSNTCEPALSTSNPKEPHSTRNKRNGRFMIHRDKWFKAYQTKKESSIEPSQKVDMNVQHVQDEIIIDDIPGFEKQNNPSVHDRSNQSNNENSFVTVPNQSFSFANSGSSTPVFKTTTVKQELTESINANDSKKPDPVIPTPQLLSFLPPLDDSPISNLLNKSVSAALNENEKETEAPEQKDYRQRLRARTQVRASTLSPFYNKEDNMSLSDLAKKLNS